MKNSFTTFLALAMILILLPLCLLPGCRRESSDKPDTIAVIDVINNLGNYQDIAVSELISDFEYIPLETTDNCLIGAVHTIITTSSHIFLQSYVGGGIPGVLLPGVT